jgi:hypothetical protein
VAAVLTGGQAGVLLEDPVEVALVGEAADVRRWIEISRDTLSFLSR